MRAALVHYWLLNRRGGEKVLEALGQLLPDADIFTLFCDPATLSPELRSHRIVTSFLNPLRRWHRSLLPLMPMALESLDLRGYDLVVSNESGPAKGVILPANTRHVCYCLTPMRYLWDLYHEYRNEYVRSRIVRGMMTPIANYLRLWDFASAQHVDQFIADSENVRNRVWKAYRRDSEVIHPPVEVDSFYWKPPGDYFLIVSELVPYKRVDTAVRVFSRTGRRLVIAGDGTEYRKLKVLAGKSVEFAGRVPDNQLRELYASCRAFLLPGEEDFGMTPVEALASGKPVIALGRGGVLETVPLDDPVGGVLYASPDEMQLEDALVTFEKIEAGISYPALQRHAQRFSSREFLQKMSGALGLPPIAKPTVNSAVN